MCSTMASFLPVKYEQTLGHYIWETTHTFFEERVASPSALKFSFSTNSGIKNISVPFALLT